jgi:PAS domain S-box-containing protein
MSEKTTFRIWSAVTCTIAGVTLAACLALGQSILHSSYQFAVWESRQEAAGRAHKGWASVHAAATGTTRKGMTQMQADFRKALRSVREVYPSSGEVAQLIRHSEKTLALLLDNPLDGSAEQVLAASQSSAVLAGWEKQVQRAQSELISIVSGPRRPWILAALLTLLAGSVTLSLIVLLGSYGKMSGVRESSRCSLDSYESRYQRLFEHILEGFYRTSQDGKLLAANPALLQMLGYPPETDLASIHIGRDCYVDAEQRHKLTAKLEQDGLLRNEELLLRRRDGVEIVVIENARMVRDDQGNSYYEGTLVDITHRVRAEREAFRQASRAEVAQQKLEQHAAQLERQSAELSAARDKAVEVSRNKSAFLANLCQQVRGPVRGLFGMSELLLDTNLTPEQREFAEQAARSAVSLLRTLDDVEDYACLEKGVAEFVRAKFDLHRLLEDCILRFAEKAEEKGVELVLRIHPGVPSHLLGDASRLAQVLEILLANALKFTDSGEVVLTASLIAGGNVVQLRFQAEDSGQGIYPEAFRDLFEPFARAGSRLAGNGLGLALAKGIVDSMHGWIGVDSEPGQGSLFWFVLNFAGAPVDSSMPVRRLSGKKALVVDAVPSARGALAELLLSWDIHVVAAPDLESAMGAANRTEESFDFVLLDYNLSSTGGLEFVDNLLRAPALTSSRCLLLSPNSHRKYADEPILRGIHTIVPKPVLPSELWTRITGTISSKHANSLASLQSSLCVEPAPPVSPATPEPLPVLLVEDNKANQVVARRQLEKLGLHCVVAENGLQAVEAIRDRPFLFVLMDWQMPVMDGLEATALIRKMPSPAKDTPIIALTANAMRGDRERCLAAGMNDYLCKPVQWADMRALVEKWSSRPVAAG